jgi:hypothetical protein
MWFAEKSGTERAKRSRNRGSDAEIYPCRQKKLFVCGAVRLLITKQPAANAKVLIDGDRDSGSIYHSYSVRSR